MKQDLIKFLGADWMPDVERIEDSYVTNHPAVEVYPACNLFAHSFLLTLITWASNNGYSYYIDALGGCVRMKIYEDVELTQS